MILSPVIRQRYFDNNGNPLAGGKLYSYQAGTTTPQVTYADRAGTSNTNPVVLDSNGEANVWINSSLAYKFVLKDSADVTQWTVDGITDPNASEIPQWNSNQTYSMGSIVRDASGYGLLYVSLTDNNTTNSLSSVGNWRLFGGNQRTVTSNTTIAVTDNLIRSDSTSGSLTHTLPACSTTSLGARITVKEVSTGSNTTSVRGNGTDTVGGVVTYATALRTNEAVTVENMGTRWDVVYAYHTQDGSLVTAKLADGAITAPKLADGSVTQAKLASRATGTTVAAGGIAVSASSGNFSTTSGTFVDVTNLSVTITSTGRPVRLKLISDGTIGTLGFSFPGLGGANSGTVSYFNFCRGGTPIAYSSLIGQAAPASFQHTDIVAAGTYTYKMQIAGYSSNCSVERVKLVAYED